MQGYSTDVLICGAGAAGLTLAIDLARHGVRFRVIEKMPVPFQGSRGKGIQPRTQEVFEDLGILDRIVALGGVYPPQREYHEDGSSTESEVVESRGLTPAEPYHIPLMVPQFLTERVMRERLAELGCWVDFGCELVGLEQDDDGVSARLSGPQGAEHLRVRYLVGADGGRSFVRHTLHIGFPGKTLGMRALVADVVLSGLDRDEWHRFNADSMQTQVAICPLAGTDLFQIQAPIPLDGDIDLSASGLSALIASRTGRRNIVIESVSWGSAYHMNARLADRYRAGRAFLVGDAAHVHPPTGGQGLNTSVQDSYNLGWKLATVIAGRSDALLDSYEEERRPIAADVLGLSTGLLDAAKRGDIRRGRDVHQLDLGYRNSSLALEKPRHLVGVRAGDRAPDAPVRGVAGQPKRLFDLLSGPHWTLLGYEVPLEPVSARAGLRIHRFGGNGGLVDEGGHVRKACGLHAGEWVLVRPDGYVGAVVASAHLKTLERYLQNVGLGAEHPVPV